jgi:hypothetical protein
LGSGELNCLTPDWSSFAVRLCHVFFNQHWIQDRRRLHRAEVVIGALAFCVLCLCPGGSHKLHGLSILVWCIYGKLVVLCPVVLVFAIECTVSRVEKVEGRLRLAIGCNIRTEMFGTAVRSATRISDSLCIGTG